MRTLGRSPGAHGEPRGASLVELLVALVLFGLVGTAVLAVLDRQSRLHEALTVLLESRVQHAATHETVGVMLRGASPAAGDVEVLSDSAIAWRLPMGGGVACLLAPSRIVFAPDTVSGGQVLTRVPELPQAGDSAWLLDEGPTDATIDDAWRGVRIAGAYRSAGACAGSPLLGASDAARASWVLDVSGALPASPGAGPGTPVRLTRRARFALYRSGSESWLGFAEWNAATGAWNVIQPVSGPYRHYSAALPSASGIALAPRDSNGVTLWGNPRQPAAVAFATRTRTRPISLVGRDRRSVDDSLHTIISLRNAR